MEEIIEEIKEFIEERDWKKYHTLKDLSLSISLESAELLELFQWRDSEEALKSSEQEMKEEVADVLIYCFQFCEALGVDPKEVIQEKMILNGQKYPVGKENK